MYLEVNQYSLYQYHVQLLSAKYVVILLIVMNEYKTNVRRL